MWKCASPTSFRRPLGKTRVVNIATVGCVHASYELAAAGKPWWVRAPPDQWSASRPLLGLLSVPAGWMVFAALNRWRFTPLRSDGEWQPIRWRSGAIRRLGGASLRAMC
jgi:hypothetical protein